MARYVDVKALNSLHGKPIDMAPVASLVIIECTATVKNSFKKAEVSHMQDKN